MQKDTTSLLRQVVNLLMLSVNRIFGKFRHELLPTQIEASK